MYYGQSGSSFAGFRSNVLNAAAWEPTPIARVAPNSRTSLVTHPDLQRATGPAAPALAVMTRVGFGAKGIVTILVGVLALASPCGGAARSPARKARWSGCWASRSAG